MAEAGGQRQGKRVAVGMSGGVDSSVAALLLKRAGHDVTGVFIRSWEDDGKCPAGEDAVAAAAAADCIGVELESADFLEEYRSEVFASFLDELRAGRTPNPDVWCNAVVKFEAFVGYASQELGVETVATGHYARKSPDGSALLKAEDEGKDQTYFLHRITQERLGQALFPLGGMRKSEVRETARAAGLPNAERAESMGICFVGARSFPDFVSDYLPRKKGAVLDAAGDQVGEHDGAHLYTIGQRHGLGLGGPGEPWYVCGKDMAANTLTVVRGRGDPRLLSARMKLGDCHWIAGDRPREEWVYTCRFRHRMEPAPCVLSAVSGQEAQVEFAAPQWAVAPGQAGVLYDGVKCLGGGTIMSTG